MLNQYVFLSGKHYVVRQGNLEGAIKFKSEKEARVYQAHEEIMQLNYLIEQAAKALKRIDANALSKLSDYIPKNIEI